MATFQNHVVVVGAGVAGASSAYHLSRFPSVKITVVDCGIAGVGKVDSQEPNPETIFAQASGSAVMSSAQTIKMMTQLYASSSQDFINHHGEEGARRYLLLSKEGMSKEKELAALVLPDPESQIRQLGSYYLACSPAAAEELEEEFKLLKQLGFETCEWKTAEEMRQVDGAPQSCCAGIYLPDDAIINSSEYSRALLRAAKSRGNVVVSEDSLAVTAVTTVDNKAVVTFADNSQVICDQVIVATGGLFTDPTLCGILNPCWSYLASIQVSDETTTSVPKFSPNFFTWGFTHDWCWTEGRVRCSGEDHFSALKPPRALERCANLAKWVKSMYPESFDRSTPLPEYHWQYGVYSETPDSVPVVGHVTAASRVCYLLGCNAWGQTVLSYAAMLVPGLLGLEEFSPDQKEALRLLSIRRFTFLSCRR